MHTKGSPSVTLFALCGSFQICCIQTSGKWAQIAIEIFVMHGEMFPIKLVAFIKRLFYNTGFFKNAIIVRGKCSGLASCVALDNIIFIKVP
jgi:hypothetical protein